MVSGKVVYKVSVYGFWYLLNGLYLITFNLYSRNSVGDVEIVVDVFMILSQEFIFRVSIIDLVGGLGGGKVMGEDFWWIIEDQGWILFKKRIYNIFSFLLQFLIFFFFMISVGVI